jgi:hypothetical protein
MRHDEQADAETETYEHIPWSQLTLSSSSDRGKWMYVVAGLLVVAAIGAVIARMVWRPEVAVALPTTLPTSSQPAATEPPDSPPEPVLYSEADLMAAVVPQDVARRAAATAERFLRQWTSPVDGPWTYVEWATADKVEDLGDGLFRVRMVFQLLHGGTEGTVRLPVEAAEVTVKIEGEAANVIDGPIPAQVVQTVVVEPAAEPADLPDALGAAALETASVWGSPTILNGGLVDDLWRVVVEIQSPSGPLRTVAVWLTPDGRPADPVP